LRSKSQIFAEFFIRKFGAFYFEIAPKKFEAMISIQKSCQKVRMTWGNDQKKNLGPIGCDPQKIFGIIVPRYSLGTIIETLQAAT